MAPSRALVVSVLPSDGEVSRLDEICLTDPVPRSSRRRRRTYAPKCPGEQADSRRLLDRESQSWWDRLHASEPTRGWAIAELHERLRREAAFHVRRRVRDSSDFPRSDIDDLATQAAGDALVVLLRKLDDYRGDSQFLTWARRFAALEAPVSIRRRRGHDRVGISEDPQRALVVADPAGSLQDRTEIRELLRIVSDIVANHLTARQRVILIAVAIDGVSAETVAGELHTTPGAIYKSLHDARAKLRPQLA